MAAASMPSPIPKADWAHWKVARCGGFKECRQLVERPAQCGKRQRNGRPVTVTVAPLQVHSPQQNQIDCPFFPATMVELAQELIDVIIEHTSTENKDSSCSGTWWRPTDRSTLMACAQVTHAFLVPSQRCLFRPPENYVRGIAQNSILTSYVQDLMIDLDFADNSTLTPLAPILPMFQEVCRLAIQYIREGMRMNHPLSLPSSGPHFFPFFGFSKKHPDFNPVQNKFLVGRKRIANQRSRDTMAMSQPKALQGGKPKKGKKCGPELGRDRG
ncbi:hypothetical protein B0H13DRAFT_1859290 [Mycena leptocephala]|nr:hypothetical protein B0H13DRAFT_1859290 [Mycena leptocephala]